MLALRRALNDPGRCQDVIAHRLIFCETAQRKPTEDLLLTCLCCGRFLAYCCSCTERRLLAEQSSQYFDEEPPKLCHYYKVAFVDGSCLENGEEGATAGIGIVIGADPRTMHWAIPIDDEVDPACVRTSQRAELLAAIQGIHKLAEYQNYDHAFEPGKVREGHKDSNDKVTWVITSDSEYVVLGMTEWVPGWKRNRWRTSAQKRPKNLDLFQKLDAAVEHYERQYNVRIAFWRISRAYNDAADDLARFSARGHTVVPVQFNEPIKYFASENDGTH